MNFYRWLFGLSHRARIVGVSFVAGFPCVAVAEYANRHVWEPLGYHPSPLGTFGEAIAYSVFVGVVLGFLFPLPATKGTAL